jgi:DNA-nicking Smr family endonuclease
MSRRRQLSDEEHELWSGVVRSITPLRSAERKPKPKSKPAAEPVVVASTSPKTPRARARREASPTPKMPPLTPFDRRLKQRVARGRETIDARIDLHGMTQSQAHDALARFLRRAQADGARIALVVTGKGAGGNTRDAERGVLRRQVPLWLALPEFRSLIVGFEEAHVSHGGQGAIYVRLRRSR